MRVAWVIRARGAWNAIVGKGSLREVIQFRTQTGNVPVPGDQIQLAHEARQLFSLDYVTMVTCLQVFFSTLSCASVIIMYF